MPVITDIKQQKRSKGRFSVYVDGQYSFALSDLDLGSSGLRVGQEVTAQEIEAFKTGGEESKAYNMAIRYLSVRVRSVKEVRDYLAKKGMDEGLSGGVIQRLERAGLLNDRDFAAAWVADRQLLRPRSRRRLEQELMMKGVSSEDIGVVMGELGQEDELQSLMAVIEKKRRLAQYQEQDKLIGYLARQGYKYDLIKKALEGLDSGADSSWD